MVSEATTMMLDGCFHECGGWLLLLVHQPASHACLRCFALLASNDGGSYYEP